MTNNSENSGRHQGQFKPGQSGNPAGKPKGTRNKATLAVEALLDGEAEELTRKAIELAKTGDIPALRICLDRILPPRKDRPLNLDPALTKDRRKGERENGKRGNPDEGGENCERPG